MIQRFPNGIKACSSIQNSSAESLCYSLPHSHTRTPAMFKSMLLALFVSTVLAVPAVKREDLCDVHSVTLDLPSSETGTPLATPLASGPVFIGLGVGVQNYTCTTTGTYTYGYLPYFDSPHSSSSTLVLEMWVHWQNYSTSLAYLPHTTTMSPMQPGLCGSTPLLISPQRM